MEIPDNNRDVQDFELFRITNIPVVVRFFFSYHDLQAWVICTGSFFFVKVAAVGDLLLTVRSRDAVHPTVCVISEVVAYNTIRVTWWLTLEELSVLNVEAPPALNFLSYSNLLKCRLKEVVEDCSTVGVINGCDIQDVSFHISCEGS